MTGETFFYFSEMTYLQWIQNFLTFLDYWIQLSIVFRFVFISESENYTEELFKDPYIQKHSKVAAVRKVYGPKKHIISFSYNFFNPGHVIPTYVWSEKKNMKWTDIFTPNDNFQGYEFNVCITRM